jgi:hypothetical protein
LSDTIEINLSVNIGSTPPYVKIHLNGETKIFEGLLQQPLKIKQEIELTDRLKIKIEKSGKTKAVVESGEPQEVVVDKVLLNGMDQHADKFGEFKERDNPYVGERSCQGNFLALNGTWTFDVPIFRQKFKPDLDHEYRDEFVDTEIACFGCSLTYGLYLESNQTWPHYLSPTKAKNFGFYGNSISSIVGTALWYVDNFKCRKMILLLPHPCRLQLEHDDGSIHDLLPQHSPKAEKMFKHLMRDIVLFGEASLMISGYANALKAILRKINSVTELHLSSYQKDTYDLLPQLTDGVCNILPFYQTSKDHEFAKHGEHPGPEHNRIFAEQIRPIIGG